MCYNRRVSGLERLTVKECVDQTIVVQLLLGGQNTDLNHFNIREKKVEDTRGGR